MVRVIHAPAHERCCTFLMTRTTPLDNEKYDTIISFDFLLCYLPF